jgi:putative transcriptional regulator
MKAKA